MSVSIATVASLTEHRRVTSCADGSLCLIWENATIRLPRYDLGHLLTLIDTWEEAEELPGLRRGYYRVEHSPAGGLQLWLGGAGISLSRDDLRVLGGLLRNAEAYLECSVSCRCGVGPEYRRLLCHTPERVAAN